MAARGPIVVALEMKRDGDIREKTNLSERIKKKKKLHKVIRSPAELHF